MMAEHLTISYSNKRKFISLLIGIIWIIIAIGYFYLYNAMDWRVYLNFIVGILFLLSAFWQYNHSYIVILEDRIVINSFPRKEIKIEELSDLRNDSTHFIFKTSDKTIKVTKALIEKSEYNNFENFYIQLKEKLSLNVV
jgi:hypothetical protein